MYTHTHANESRNVTLRISSVLAGRLSKRAESVVKGDIYTRHRHLSSRRRRDRLMLPTAYPDTFQSSVAENAITPAVSDFDVRHTVVVRYDKHARAFIRWKRSVVCVYATTRLCPSASPPATIRFVFVARTRPPCFLFSRIFFSLARNAADPLLPIPGAAFVFL